MLLELRSPDTGGCWAWPPEGGGKNPVRIPETRRYFCGPAKGVVSQDTQPPFTDLKSRSMASVYRIGDLTLDAGRQELCRGDEPIRLGALSYRFLLALTEAAPDVVSHDALARAVWDGRAVSPETISQRGKMLRAAIGDDAHDRRYIESLRGRGYRLIPPVITTVRRDARRPLGLRGIGIAAVLALAAATLLLRFAGPAKEPPARPIPSIAVLPFADMSPGQDQRYFADGMSEEILNLLSRTTSLNVIARTSAFSFRDQNADIATIAGKLNVSHVLEGSVRRSEDRVRISVQLIAASDGTHLWSESYDGELRNVLQLQHEIAASVAAALEFNLLGRASPARPTATRVNPEAFDAYLRGRQQMRFIGPRTNAEAERYFKRSIEIDPAFLPAYSSLGMVYVRQILELDVPIGQNLEELRGIVQQGLTTAPDDPALIALSGQVARYDGNMVVAEQRLRRAFELDPSNDLIVTLYGMFKQDQGYPREALRVALRLLERDPLNPVLYIQVWAAHMDLGNASEAMAAAMRYNEAVAVPSSVGLTLRGWASVTLLGDIVGGIRDRELADVADGATRSYASPDQYYDIGDMEQGNAALELLGPEAMHFAAAYRNLITGEVRKARELALHAITNRKKPGYSAYYDDTAWMRLATDALIAAGEAHRAVELIENMAPVYADYRSRAHIDPQEFSPAPYPVKSTYSSYPALYFPDYVRALRAAGDANGADNMLRHLEAILRLRRERGLFVEERHVAEARALRGDFEGALDALEQAERDRTIYVRWHLFLEHNEIFAEIRRHPRFEALVSRVSEEMRRQRATLENVPRRPDRVTTGTRPVD